MGLSGFLYLAIVVGWAVYLVPFALKRYDEATRNRSIDRFSSAMRVLGRDEAERAPSSHRDANTEAAPPEAEPAPPAPPAPDREVQRTAARVAARRRRRVLLTLLLTTAGTGVAAALAALPSWSAVVSGMLLVLWLVVCRSQARREYAARPADRTERPPAPVAEPRRSAADEAVDALPAEGRADVAAETDVAASGETDVVDVAPSEVPADDEPTVVIAREDMSAAEEQQPAGSGSLWDPVPVTLPTYVHKPRAPRTMRTIDLGTEEARTPRRSEESAIYTHRTHTVEHSGAEQQESDEAPKAREQSGPTRRAVGE